MNPKQQIAKTLLDLQAVSISPHKPFTWASGLSSPLYCDNRLIISSVEERRSVTSEFTKCIAAEGWRPNAVAGTATAGIPHAAWIAEALSLPMVYVRSSEKKHGKQNTIEGRLPETARVVLIEDLISTGGSVIKAAHDLISAGAEVLGVIAIFQYGMAKARNAFQQAGLPYTTLTDLETLLEVAVREKRLNDAERTIVRQWREDPIAWSDEHVKKAAR